MAEIFQVTHKDLLRTIPNHQEAGGVEGIFTHPHQDLVCQVCQKPGHVAFDCYHRLIMAINVNPPQQCKPYGHSSQSHGRC
jgi:hypothetical protein